MATGTISRSYKRRLGFLDPLNLFVTSVLGSTSALFTTKEPTRGVMADGFSNLCRTYHRRNSIHRMVVEFCESS